MCLADREGQMLYQFVKERYRHFRLNRERLSVTCDMPVTKLGGQHGWPVLPGLMNSDSVVYSFGVGSNVDWDLEMIDRFGVQIHAFDPTPESIEWVARQQLPREFHFHDYGIAAFDGVLNFYPPKKPGRINYSQDKRKFNQSDQPQVAGQVCRLSTILRRLGHARIDVLKIDVEGTEFDCLPEILNARIEIGQLLVEVHYHHPSRSFSQGVQLLKQVQAAGFECFDISPRGLEFAFVNRRPLEKRRAA